MQQKDIQSGQKSPQQGGESKWGELSHGCTHKPKLVVEKEGGKGWSLYGARISDINVAAGWEFDLLINCTGRSIGSSVVIPLLPTCLKMLKRWVKRENEMVIDWPDMSTPALPREFWVELARQIRKRRMKVCVFCMGGHGRTGTALSILIGLLTGQAAQEAIGEVRSKHCRKAVETHAQTRYVESMLATRAGTQTTNRPHRKGQKVGAGHRK